MGIHILFQCFITIPQYSLLYIGYSLRTLQTSTSLPHRISPRRTGPHLISLTLHFYVALPSLGALTLEEIAISLKTLLLLCLGVNSLEGITLGAGLAVSLPDGLDVGDNLSAAELATREGLYMISISICNISK
jgi:hypothetical protein